MTRLESLEQDVFDAGIDVWEVPFNAPQLRGEYGQIYCIDGRHHIFLRDDMHSAMRLAILAHEYGHFMTGYKSTTDTKDEARAWHWAYERLLPRPDLLRAITRQICRDDSHIDLADLAEVFDVPNWFIRNAMEYFFSDN